jgi:antitoxin FitA
VIAREGSRRSTKLRNYRVTMSLQCSYNGVMTTAITVRNVPEDVRDELAARASRSGRSLQEFLLNLLTEVASRPSVEEVVGRARERARLTGSGMNVASILSDRDAERR